MLCFKTYSCFYDILCHRAVHAGEGDKDAESYNRHIGGGYPSDIVSVHTHLIPCGLSLGIDLFRKDLHDGALRENTSLVGVGILAGLR